MGERPARADAVRNRHAILRAAEDLLAAHDAEHVSLDRVAAEAGVGKGTVFRRFGNRTGLFQELLAERAEQLALAICSGPPPLGPGAPARDRLLAFSAALAELTAENVALIAAHERACAQARYQDPTYQRWHAHVSSLLSRPNADFVAHVLLAAFDVDLVRHVLANGGRDHLTTSAHDLAATLYGP